MYQAVGNGLGQARSASERQKSCDSGYSESLVKGRQFEIPLEKMRALIRVNTLDKNLP
jgi:hypothetical protein